MSVQGSAKVSLPTLTAMVVGSMVGAGVFSLPQRFAASTGVAGTLIAWGIAGTGMLTLALVFQRLAVRRPDLDAGVYSYAKAGFGDFMGFIATSGYWASSFLGNVTYWVLITSTLGQWFPALGAGDTPLAVLVSSIGLWSFFFLVRRGIREATAINRIVTVAKIVPIAVFLLLAVFVFDPAVFAANWSGGAGSAPLFDQVRDTMLITVFVFIGVEGASVFSRYARTRRDVGRATVLGFLSVLSIFASVTIVSFGVLPTAELAALPQPSMAGVLEAAVGSWGGVLVSIGMIIAVLGAYLAWTLMAAEVVAEAAEHGDMPRFLATQNRRGAPVNALVLSIALAQVALVLTYFSADAFDFALDMTSVMVLVPFLLAALYALKLRVTRETYAEAGRAVLWGDLAIAALASAYTAFLLFAAGIDLLLLSCLFYAPATVLFAMTRREQGRRPFRARELVMLAVVIAMAVAALVGLATGRIAP
ncbi:basic amino acid/polyamine antiporter [Microbacterium halophytorum]|uniref:basic amino acid/polyamine antiporter n=1 Tax=Microbacterium halophytorum TaxID=2067568 RepID=UPI000CFB8ED2|nr:basic amino acid/polyamine antiporter [Microbacterium halophytorum]